MSENSKNKIVPIIYGIALLMAGLLILIFALVNPGIINDVISYSVAIALFGIGLAHVLSSLITKTKAFFDLGLILGAILIAIGVVFIIDRGLITSFLVYFVGALLIAVGAISLSKGIICAIYKLRKSWVFFYITLGIITIALGILAFVFRGQSAQILYACIGAIILITGVSETFVALKNAVKK